MNPRPNVELMCFLRAYSSLGFRAVAGRRRPTAALSSEISESRTRRRGSYSRNSYTAGSISLETWAIGRCPVPATVAGIKLIYCASIRQRERSCFRHLNWSMSILKSFGIIALHACAPLLHAVKAGQPRVSVSISFAKLVISADNRKFFLTFIWLFHFFNITFAAR